MFNVVLILVLSIMLVVGKLNAQEWRLVTEISNSNVSSLGESVELSSDGLTLISTASNLQNNYVYLYKYDNNSNDFVQEGTPYSASSQTCNINATLSGDAKTLGVGIESSFFCNQGKILTYRNSNSQWNQIGEFREEDWDEFVFSNDGNTFAFIKGLNPDYAIVYQWQNNQWIQKGDTITLSNSYDLGIRIDLSADGNTVAVDASYLQDNGAIVFEWKNNQWVQKGSHIPYELQDMDLSTDGNTLVLAYHSDRNKVYAQVYQFSASTNTWNPKGKEIALIPTCAPNFELVSTKIANNGNRVILLYNTCQTMELSILDYNTSTQDWVKDTTIDTKLEGSPRALSASTDGSIIAIGAPSQGNSGVVAIYSNSLISSNIYTQNSELQNIKLYPTPINNELNINLPHSLKYVNLSVYSIEGKKVFSNTYYNTDNIKLNFYYPNGTYIIKLKTDKAEAFAKVFK